MALMFGILAPVLLGVAGGAVDFGAFVNHRLELQAAADSASLAAAKEAGLSGWTENAARAVVESYLDINLRAGGSGIYTADVQVDATAKQVTVVLEQDHRPYFVVGYFQGSPQIRVRSTAQASNSSNICVIGLHPSDEGTISMNTNAVLSAPRCAVYSNAESEKGLISEGNANLIADLACTAGGFGGAARNFNKLPLTDCPSVKDPLESRPAPEVSACSQHDAVYQSFVGQLNPGVYCGGLTIRASSEVTLKPGVYVIKDGPLIIESSSHVEAKGVGFYFTGPDARFEFASSSIVNVEAPKTGPMAGLIAFQDRDSAEADFVITSNKARKLLGTIYLPMGNLIVDANNKVADASAYTAVVVRRLHLSKGPNLVLNAEYNATSVPVPEGVGPQSVTTRLVN
ncbi:pilus assembly protein TadG-related protein [Metarhizobium album]|nr:pilus assembly protein TadG-related protein [Rhizobium album]